MLRRPSFALLLTGRIVQGLGTGIALPLMFNLVLEEVPAQKTGFMMGVACMITAMAPVVGPFAGGLIRAGGLFLCLCCPCCCFR